MECAVGGRGSGHFAWRRTKRGLVECAVSIDISSLIRTGLIKPGSAVEGQFEAAAPLGSHRVIVRYDSNLTELNQSSLTFSFMSRGSWHHQAVQLMISRPPLGGIRVWFACPNTTKAHNLAYRSQGEPAHLRMITQAQNIRARLKGDLSIYAPFPRRPKGMHQRTYDRLRAKALRIETCILEALMIRGR
jgi:hypothetical protein